MGIATIVKHGRSLVTAMALVALVAFAHAAGPVETSVFAVQGVEVDVTDTDAATAKNKALVEVQVKAFRQLAERMGSPEILADVEAMEDKDILPFLKSLSIEKESISPGRYAGTLTVRFLPDRVKSFYAKRGVRVVSQQGPSFLVVPVWQPAEGVTQLWEDNPWRRAWINLRAEQSLVPVITALGDLDDSAILTVDDVLTGNEIKLEALRRRYDVQTVLIAFARPEEDGGVHARMTGDTPLGKMNFDKEYVAETATIDDSAALATKRFHAVMVEKYRSNSTRVVDEADAEQAAQESASRRSALSVAIPFGGPSEWNRLRSRILSAPGVVGLDVSSLGGDGAVVRLTFTGDVEAMQSRFQRVGLQLSQAGSAWVIQPL